MLNSLFETRESSSPLNTADVLILWLCHFTKMGFMSSLAKIGLICD